MSQENHHLRAELGVVGLVLDTVAKNTKAVLHDKQDIQLEYEECLRHCHTAHKWGHLPHEGGSHESDECDQS